DGRGDGRVQERVDAIEAALTRADVVGGAEVRMPDVVHGPAVVVEVRALNVRPPLVEADLLVLMGPLRDGRRNGVEDGRADDLVADDEPGVTREADPVARLLGVVRQEVKFLRGVL